MLLVLSNPSSFSLTDMQVNKKHKRDFFQTFVHCDDNFAVTQHLVCIAVGLADRMNCSTDLGPVQTTEQWFGHMSHSSVPSFFPMLILQMALLVLILSFYDKAAVLLFHKSAC